MCAVSLSMPYVGIKIANGHLWFMYRPILQFNIFYLKRYIISKVVLPTFDAWGKYFLLENLSSVKHLNSRPHSTFFCTILSFTLNSVWGTIYSPWIYVCSFSHTFFSIHTNMEYVACIFCLSTVNWNSGKKLIFGYGFSQLQSLGLPTAFEPRRFLDKGAKYYVASR